MRTPVSRILVLGLLTLTVGFRSLVPAGFMPGQDRWIDFCPSQGWHAGFLERVSASSASDAHGHHAGHDAGGAHHGPDDAETSQLQCPWAPQVSDYIPTARVLPTPQPAESPAPVGLPLLLLRPVAIRLPPARAPPRPRFA